MSKLKDIAHANSPYNDGFARQYYKDKLTEDIVDNKEVNYVYESPDSGKTVYKRAFGSTERELISQEDFKNEQDS
tara:strand:+ start:236 stop:460 length:225 start_codon:yes stop_codon:yes gene_type:complete